MSAASGNHQVLEWLDENRWRMFPLQAGTDLRIVLPGTGELSIAPGTPAITSRHPDGWLVSGGRELLGPSGVVRPSTRFEVEISVGDQIQLSTVPGGTLDVLEVVNQHQLVARPSPVLSGLLSRGPFWFQVLRRRQAANRGGFSLEGCLRDACLLYFDRPVSDQARLLSLTPVGDDLELLVSDQEPFRLENYRDPGTTYPVYLRNARGSLLVVGQEAAQLQSRLALQGAFFEPTVIHRLDGPWRGVKSLQFGMQPVLTGEVELLPGWQIGLLADPAQPVLEVSAGRRYGRPLPCSPILPDVPSDCGLAVRSLSGARPVANLGDLTLQGTGPVVVLPDPENHRVFIGLNFGRADVCSPLPFRPS